ncbi:MAG TPA: GNAT family N-acetyltransferase [Methylotenera sp.]|nr:GNAT family N-acetyltransferase [Methylotenera sp.]
MGGKGLKNNFLIKHATWQTHAPQLKSVREAVFIQEQQVPPALEWDSLDEAAQHLLAVTAAGDVLGCARLTGDGNIGRMAVLKLWRGIGVGGALLTEAISIYQQLGVEKIRLSAQMHAVSFYEKFGFKKYGEPYLDADIMHIDMQLIQ